VLEKDVDEGRSSFQIDAEQQVGVAVAVAEFDEGTRLDAERCPVELGDKGRRKYRGSSTRACSGLEKIS